MTKKEKKQFVKDLSRKIEKAVTRVIDQGYMPEEWDGHELRCYLRDCYVAAASRTAIVKEPRGARARAYRNTIRIIPGP